MRTAAVNRIALVDHRAGRALGLVVLWARRLILRRAQELRVSAGAAEPELPPRGLADAYARNAAVMTVGTSLSRFTGFLRIAAQTGRPGRHAPAPSPTPTTRANTTPNILYELALGGILTSVFVPLFVEWMQTQGRDAVVGAWPTGCFTLALVGLSAIALLGAIFAPWIIRLYNVRRCAPRTAQAAARAGHLLPAVVHAADRLLRDRGRSRAAC